MILESSNCIMICSYLHWPGCTISQGTDGVTLDLLTDLPNHVNLCRPCITTYKTPHHIVHPVHSYTTEKGEEVVKAIRIVSVLL